MPLHSGTRTRLLARVVVASVAASLVVSTMQLPGVKRNVAQAAGVATVDSYVTLNGTSQYFTAAHNSTFDFTGNITFSAWIRPSSTCFTANRYCTIMSKENSWLFSISAGEFQYALMPASGIWAFQSTGVTAIPGQWQHISYATNKSTNTITLFLNGKQLFTQTNSATVPNPTKVSTGALQIGSREIANPSQNFVGDIDEVRVYNTVRATEALAQADMNTWGPANNTGLVLYYDFNESAGSALENTVTGAASATHMTAVGSPIWTDVKTTTVLNNRNLVAFPRSYLTSAGGYTMPTGVTSLDYLVVAGGGGGMSRHGGGGGAGGLLTATNYTISSGAVLGIAVGGGGKGQNAARSLDARNGTDSLLSVGGTAVATAVGGGAGNATGGSGGGSSYLSSYGNGTPGQGNRGGAGGGGDGACPGSSSGWCGGGGGGAGAEGVAADLANNGRAGNGGVGLASALLTTSAATTLGIGQVVSSSVFFAGGGTFGKAPLTLFDCFNSNSFGQVIFPAVSGALTEFRMKATCLVPSGTTPLDLYALVYELNADATKIPGASPIAATYVPLTSCPRATTWQGKTFRSSDFSYLNIPFTGVSLSAGKFYGIYFAGKGVPGTPPVGAAPALERARQATTTTTTSTTTTTPWSAFKNQKNVIPKTATTIARRTGSATTTSTTTTTVKRTTASTLPAIPRPTLTALPASLGVNTALRTMLKADEARFILKSTTPLNCVAALRFVIATKAGTCRINVAKRSNGFVLQTISLKVAKTGVLGPDIVAVNEPVTVYFTGGTSNFQKSAAKTLKTTAVAAKNANVVFVGGYTGNVTNDAVNEKLAEVRASKTRSALREAGVTATIAVMSFGSSGAVTKGKSNAEQNRNRRAVIYIVP